MDPHVENSRTSDAKSREEPPLDFEEANLRFPRGSLPPQRNAGAWMAEAVRSRFPKLAAALGDAAFEAMLAKYMTHEPAARTSVRESGARLATFLASEHHPVWHCELAALDRAHVEVSHAPGMATMARRD